MAKTDLTKVDYEDGTLAFNADMRMGELRKLMRCGSTGDLDGMIEVYTKIVKAWPYEGDPSEDAAWDDLAKSQFVLLNEALMTALGDAGEG